MRLKLISLLLLFLFTLVIAFPGYGNGTATAVSQKETVIKVKKKQPVSLLGLIKRCLAKGINLIEEERNMEEDEDSSSAKEICYLMSSQHRFELPSVNLRRMHRIEEHGLMNMRSVPYPPPNFC